MYAVTAYASWTDVEARNVAYHATYRERSYALRVVQEGPWPIVDVRNVGEAGHCPGGNVGTHVTLSCLCYDPQPSDNLRSGTYAVCLACGSAIVGHRFTATREPAECLACGGWESDLYVPGTYIPAEPRYSVAGGTIGGGNDWP